ncbi:MAG: cation-translocating P-type ATPase [Candidatus Riflebacteria bacterium]
MNHTISSNVNVPASPIDSSDYTGGLGKIVQLKIVNALLAMVFLAAGFIFKQAFPDQTQVGDLLIFIAAISVFIPILINGLKGFFEKTNRFMTEQLVMFATLALMVSGEMLAATIIPIIMVIGHILEEKSIIGIEEAINSLKNLASKLAHRLSDGKETDVAITELKINDHVVIYPGETVPIDGRVIKGQSMVNQAHLTGESSPVEVAKDSEIFAGTINLNGKLLIEVGRTSENTLLHNIASLLDEAGRTKIPAIKMIEKYLDLYFPTVIMVAASALFLTHEISRLVTVLVISCPCSFVLASPTAMIAALVVASRKGIMIRNSTFLESISEVDTMIFDKTGTITSGIFEVIDVFPEKMNEKDEVLAAAAVCASGSMHPVSQAIVRLCEEKNLGYLKAERQMELHGKGVLAESGDIQFRLGKAQWIFPELGLKPPHEDPEDNSSAVWVSSGNRILGKITLADLPRKELQTVLQESREKGVKEMVLLTGDKSNVAGQIGRLFNFDLVKAECLPQDKLDFVQACKKQGKKVMFIGDGINDALALKASDIGIAFGPGGADIAIQSSDVTLRDDSLIHIPFMFSLSRRILRTIHQNVIIGAGFSLIMIILASAGMITPIWGAIAHNFGTLFVIVNSARILNKM